MARPQTGTHVWRDGKLFARITYLNEQGRRRQKERRARDMTDVPRVLRQLANELETGGPDVFDGERMSFRQAAEAYAREHHVPARVVDGRKVEGLKSLASVRIWLAALVEHFGARPVRSITHGQIEDYKRRRLATPAVVGRNTRGTEAPGNPRERKRSITAVNRELEVLRKVLRHCHAQGWILRNPFQMGRPLINKADERKRVRIITPEEEQRILAQCRGRREHLRSYLIVAVDTFMRPNEMAHLTARDVDLQSRVVHVPEEHTKTQTRRTVGLTPRAAAELARLLDGLTPAEHVFSFARITRALRSACEAAGVEDCHPYDFRHTGITRRLYAASKAGLAPQLVMKEAGHTQLKTFLVYLNPSTDMYRQLADAVAEHFHG